MKRKTLAILGAVAAVAVVGALSIPAIAGGPGGCWGRGPGFGMVGHHGGPGWQGQGWQGQGWQGPGWHGMGPQGMNGPMRGPGYGPMGGHMGGGMYGPIGRFGAMQVFLTFDTDGDGTVTVAEAEAGMEKLRASHDADSNGTLSREEFGKLFADVTKGMADRPFAMLDANGDGQLSAEELRFPAQMMARMQAWHGQPSGPGPNSPPAPASAPKAAN